MSKKHRRSWVVVREEDCRPASGYRATLVKSDGAAVADAIFFLLDLVVFTGTIQGSEPRYRVVVSRPGSDAPMGVAEARTMRRGIRELSRVDQVIATRSHDEARSELELDF
jgi:hypothetical protein